MLGSMKNSRPLIIHGLTAFKLFLALTTNIVEITSLNEQLMKTNIHY